jgi:hypothetical protein
MCGCSTQPDVVYVTATPTQTPIPTSTPVPTNTPIPDPIIRTMQFATSEDPEDLRPSAPTFDAGPDAIYFSFDYAYVPPDSLLQIELQRDDLLLIDTEEAWNGESEGTAVLLLSDDPHILTPGYYDLDVTLAGQTLSGNFGISATDGEPGARLITDDFANRLCGWSEGSIGESDSEILDGRLMITQNTADYFAWSAIYDWFEDFDISVDVNQEEGPSDGYYGILFRMDRDGFYFFGVSVDGYMEVILFTEDDLETLVGPRWSGAIRRGQESNNLRVIAQGSEFAFYINGEQVATTTDDTCESGGIGLASGNYSTPGMVSAFDTVTMTLPPEDVQALLIPVAPAATAVPQPPPLLSIVQTTLDHVHAMGGAMDRIYYSGQPEACGPFLVDFYAVINAPEYDMSTQPGHVQTAYALYREAIGIVVDEVSRIRDTCEFGDGGVGSLAFDVTRGAINEAASRLEGAKRMLGGE